MVHVFSVVCVKCEICCNFDSVCLWVGITGLLAAGKKGYPMLNFTHFRASFTLLFQSLSRP